jgi:hypothetical protein
LHFSDRSRKEFIWFDNAGHFPFFEERQKFADQLFQRVCQGKVEMSYSRQSRNVVFCLGLRGARVNLLVPVKRRRALVATNPIKE